MLAQRINAAAAGMPSVELKRIIAAQLADNDPAVRHKLVSKGLDPEKLKRTWERYKVRGQDANGPLFYPRSDKHIHEIFNNFILSNTGVYADDSLFVSGSGYGWGGGDDSDGFEDINTVELDVVGETAPIDLHGENAWVRCMVLQKEGNNYKVYMVEVEYLMPFDEDNIWPDDVWYSYDDSTQEAAEKTVKMKMFGPAILSLYEVMILFPVLHEKLLWAYGTNEEILRALNV